MSRGWCGGGEVVPCVKASEWCVCTCRSQVLFAIDLYRTCEFVMAEAKSASSLNRDKLHGYCVSLAVGLAVTVVISMCAIFF